MAMMEWYVSFADQPTDYEQIATDVLGSLVDIEAAFEQAALTGAYRGRWLRWMVLIDGETAQRRVNMCYGNPPPSRLPMGSVSYIIDTLTMEYPIVGGG